MTSAPRTDGAPAEEPGAAGGPDETADSAGRTAEANLEREDSAEEVERDLDVLLEDVKRERDEYLELAQRARADFENYRKRAARETQDAERRAKVNLARDLVPAIDNLERALAAAPVDDPLKNGVALVHRDLGEVLTRAGVESYDPTGEPFDPATSEALATKPGDGAGSGTVLETVERGYRLDGQVIRAARVVVAE